MTKFSITFKVGTRSSKLALSQARAALDQWHGLVGAADFELVQLSSPGDRDRVLDLRQSPADFFTRDLDAAVRRGQIDAALHSAKDVGEPVAAEFDWCWLPWRADPRDVLVLPLGRTIEQLPAAPRLGVSSDRRERYCQERFPTGQLLGIRGNIEQRLQQLDGGAFDGLIMAGAALERLGLRERITEWIPLSELPSPEGQGVLCLTFGATDRRLLALRRSVVKTVSFVGAGAGSAAMLTGAGAAALRNCDRCFYDSLLDDQVLALLPPHARSIDVGKRCGAHRHSQDEINQLLADACRKGYRVVRLKGGDPGIFGRLAEEVDTLEKLDLPYRVIPGISSLAAATTATGLLLTRRGVSQGFTVMTPRRKGGGIAEVSSCGRAKLPLVLFMGLTVVDEVRQQLLADGVAAATPAAIVYGAGMPEQRIIQTTLDALPQAVAAAATALPGLLIIGEVARYRFRLDGGALAGKRILLTCSATVMPRAVQTVLDYGGVPVQRPLIQLHSEPAAAAWLTGMAAFDWLVLTSPAAVRCFAEQLRALQVDIRTMPKVLVAGPGTAAELRDLLNVRADAVPAADFGANSVLDLAHTALAPGARVLRLRSDRSGPALADRLRSLNLAVTDVVLYRNVPITYPTAPEVDAAVFASASAVEAYVAQWPLTSLAGKPIVALGPPTAAELVRQQRPADAIADVATIEATVATLAGLLVSQRLAGL